MSELIRQFYEKNGTPKLLLEQKLKKFEAHKDVAAEFEMWIKDRAFCSDSPVTVEGYTAQSLSKLSAYLDGEGAFMMLIELREQPEKGHKRIAGGFKRK